MRILKEDWPWIVVPALVLVAAAAYLYWTGDGRFSGGGGYDLR
ncbi:MAG: hypothetical protein AAF957_06280 [Planctomycetota bacterium]